MYLMRYKKGKVIFMDENENLGNGEIQRDEKDFGGEE